MTELLEAPRFSYGWIHSVLLVSVWLDSQRPPWFSYGRTLTGIPILECLDF